MKSDTMRRVLSYKRGTKLRGTSRQYQIRSVRMLIQGSKKGKSNV